jgi:hypothetical protein
MLVAWADGRSGMTSDIFSTRIKPSDQDDFRRQVAPRHHHKPNERKREQKRGDRQRQVRPGH